MTDEGSPQSRSSFKARRSAIELHYPRISTAASLDHLIQHSPSIRMAAGSESDSHESILSESWTNLSDVDYSVDDDLRSEMTDAVSIAENPGLDRIQSLDTSDASSQDAEDDGHISSSIALNKSSVERSKIIDTASIETLKQKGLEHSIVLENMRSSGQAEPGQLSLVIDTFDEKEAYQVPPYASVECEDRRLTGTVCMAISETPFASHGPFRLLYVGDTKARPQILGKLGDVLMAESKSRSSHASLDSSRYHVIHPSRNIDSQSNNPSLVPIETQIIVDDCTTAASITTDDRTRNQIFLTYKNGSLFSSRWNGTEYEISSASKWSQPDLAIFVIAPEYHPILKQRHRLVYDFIARHRVPSLVISEVVDWNSDFDDLPVNISGPHLQIEARRNGDLLDSTILKSLPIDLDTFMCLDSHQLNKSLSYLSSQANEVFSDHKSDDAPSLSCKSTDNFIKSLASRTPSLSTISQKMPWPSSQTVNSLRKPLLLTAVGLASVAFSMTACYLLFSLFAYTFAATPACQSHGTLPASTLASFSNNHQTTACQSPNWTSSLVPTVSMASGKIADSRSKDIMPAAASLELVEMMKNKSIRNTNRSENFEVHSIGDCDILVKTPSGFKIKNKKTPFKVTVSREGKVIDSKTSKLFDGVYAARIESTEAYGLLNVSIKRPDWRMPEEHQVDLGSGWLKLGRWREVAQTASEHVQNELGAIHHTMTLTCEQLVAEFRLRTRNVSKKAGQRAHSFSHRSQKVVDETANLLQQTSEKLRNATRHEQQRAFLALKKWSDVEFQNLVNHAREVNQQARVAIERARFSADRAARHLQLKFSNLHFFEIQKMMQNHLRSESLATAQERARQILNEASANLKQGSRSRDREDKKRAKARSFWSR